jgi:hypothetical protein
MRIVTYKTAFYSFYLPAASAMHLAAGFGGNGKGGRVWSV